MDSLIANNHFWRQRWSMELFNSTILSDIWPEVLFFSGFATMVALITKMTTHNLAISGQLLTVFGVVLALVISFRTSSANERYLDGARLWGVIRSSSRVLAQQIWIDVSNKRVREDGTVVPELEIIIEKKTMINLLYAFSVAVKHHLRGEPGVFYEDLYPSVKFLPKYATELTHSDDILPLWHIHGGRRMTPAAAKRKDTLLSLVSLDEPPLKPARMPPQPTIYDYFGILRLGRFIIRKFMLKANLAEAQEKRPRKRIAYAPVVESTVPMEIFLALSSYSAFLMRNDCLDHHVATAMDAELTLLLDSHANLERIINNGIPFAYQAHLRLCLWIYVFLLPFQLVEDFGYLCIPAVAFVSFLLTGFLEIGQEIENPFNYGYNDLNLDWYCDFLKLNLAEITAHPPSDPSLFIFDNRNQPFAPMDRRGVQELLGNTNSETKDREYYLVNPEDPHGELGMRSLLVRNWREVDRLTRDPAWATTFKN